MISRSAKHDSATTSERKKEIEEFREAFLQNVVVFGERNSTNLKKKLKKLWISRKKCKLPKIVDVAMWPESLPDSK
jgi:hypothetical protein